MNPRLRSFVLWISVPLCLVLAATGLQVFWPGIYSRETPASVTGALAVDLVDLCLILPVLVVSSVLAVRGSLSAFLVWTGTLGYLVYNFLIYTFAVYFNPMFLAYCAVLGLSFYGLIGLREFLSPDEVANRYTFGALRVTTAVSFLVLTVLAATGELKEIVSSILGGRLPYGVAAAAGRTDPVHVLDLCFFLPVVATAAILLLRRKAMGFTLAPGLMVTMILISIEVITIVLVAARRGQPASPGPLISFGISGTFMTGLLIWFLCSARKVAQPTEDVKVAA